MPASADEIHRLTESIEKLNQRFLGIENKLVALEGQNLNGRLTAVETRTADLDACLKPFDAQRLNDRLTGIETKVDMLQSQTPNDRLTAVETKHAVLDERLKAFDGHKFNDRLTALESQSLSNRLTAAEMKNAAIDNRVTTTEVRFVALDNQKLHERLTSEETKRSALDIQVGFYVKAGLLCAAVLLALWGVTSAASFAVIHSSAEKQAQEEVAKAVKELNVPDVTKQAVTRAIEDTVPDLVKGLSG